jgi:predicted transposase/invertase (TIGR01784 family)
MHMTRNYKASVFSSYFSDANTMLDAYSAIEGKEFPPGTEIVFNTLDDVLYKTQINDISFTVAGKIVVLAEHQSTISENTPIRFLQYLGRVYEKILDRRNMYREKLYKIPKPEFIVLYNGERPFPDHKILKLSTAFMQENAPVSLELIVNVYNINMEHNPDILSKSKSLKDYSTFIDMVRTRERDGIPLATAYTEVINYCIENEIMSDFLEIHGSEVYNMLLAEWNMDDALDVRYEEGFEDGTEKGEREGEKAKAIDSARSMKADGVDAAFISKHTGLTLAEIAEIE